MSSPVHDQFSVMFGDNRGRGAEQDMTDSPTLVTLPAEGSCAIAAEPALRPRRIFSEDPKAGVIASAFVGSMVWLVLTVVACVVASELGAGPQTGNIIAAAAGVLALAVAAGMWALPEPSPGGQL